MSIKNTNQFIGDENLIKFITTKKLDNVKFSIPCCVDMINIIRRRSVFSYAISIEGRYYLFFNSKPGSFCNLPILPSDNLLIENEEEWEKTFKDLLKLNPQFNKLEMFNDLIKSKKFTTILLNEKNGMYYATDKDYKYRLLIDKSIADNIQLLPFLNLKENTSGDFKMESPQICYSLTIQEFFPDICEKIKFCENNRIITYDLFIDTLTKCVPFYLNNILFKHDNIYKNPSLYQSHIDKLVAIIAKKEKISFCKDNLPIMSQSDGDVDKFILNMKDTGIIVSLIHFMNFDALKMPFFIFNLIEKEKIKSPIPQKKIKEKKEITISTLSIEEADRIAQELIDEEEQKTKKQKRRKSNKKIHIKDTSEIVSSLDEEKSVAVNIPKESNSEEIQLPDFFGSIKDDLLGELGGDIEEEILEEGFQLSLEEPVVDSSSSEDELLNELEEQILDPMVNDLLAFSDVPTNNSYCMFGSEEHQRRMKEWDLKELLPEIFCYPKEYLISMFSQRRHQYGYYFNYNYARSVIEYSNTPFFSIFNFAINS